MEGTDSLEIGSNFGKING